MERQLSASPARLKARGPLAPNRSVSLCITLIAVAALSFLLLPGSSAEAEGWQTALKTALETVQTTVESTVESSVERSVEGASVEMVIEGEEAGTLRMTAKVEPHRRYENVVNTGTPVTVEEDEVVEGDVVNIGGPITVRGLVEGDVVAIGGNITVSGAVEGDAVSVGGNIFLEGDACICGDGVSVGGRVTLSPESEIRGERVQISVGGLDKLFPGAIGIAMNPFLQRTLMAFAKVFRIIVLIILALLVAAIFTKQTEVAADAVKQQFWKMLLVGFLGELIIVPLLILLAVIIIGIPLIPVAMILIAAAFVLGYVAVACVVGRITWERLSTELTSPIAAAVVGIVVIELVSLLGRLISIGPGPLVLLGTLVSIVGFVIAWAAWTTGFGAAIMTRFGTKPLQLAPAPALTAASFSPPTSPPDETRTGSV